MAANIKVLPYLSHNSRPTPISDAKNHIKYMEVDRDHHRNNPYLFSDQGDFQQIEPERHFPERQFPERQLPDFSMEKLEEMCRIYGTDITYSKSGLPKVELNLGNGKPSIHIQGDIDLDNKAVSLAHNLGYLKDITDNYDGNASIWSNEFGSNPLEAEKRAWANAFELLKQTNFRNWDCFKTYCENSCLGYATNEEMKEEVRNFMKSLENRIPKNDRVIPENDRVDRREFFKRIEQQPKHGIVMHKWVISLSEDERDRLQIDMKQLAKDFMARVQMRYNIKLDWVAALHDDKGHPHVHIAVRGWADNNQRQFAVYPTHINEMRKIVEEEKIRQAERNLGKEQARDILKDMEQEREQQRIPFSPPQQGGNRFLNDIINNIIKSIENEARRTEREIARQQMIEKSKKEREKQSRSR